MLKKISSVWQRLVFCMAEARVLYGCQGGLLLCITEVHFYMEEAHGCWGFPPSKHMGRRITPIQSTFEIELFTLNGA